MLTNPKKLQLFCCKINDKSESESNHGNNIFQAGQLDDKEVFVY